MYFIVNSVLVQPRGESCESSGQCEKWSSSDETESRKESRGLWLATVASVMNVMCYYFWLNYYKMMPNKDTICVWYQSQCAILALH